MQNGDESMVIGTRNCLEAYKVDSELVDRYSRVAKRHLQYEVVRPDKRHEDVLQVLISAELPGLFREVTD